MARHKDGDWKLPMPAENWTQVQVAVLMDIRDELKRMNSLLHCHNTTEIPHTLKRIDRRLAKHAPLRKKG